VFYRDVNVQWAISVLSSVWLFKSPLAEAQHIVVAPLQAKQLVQQVWHLVCGGGGNPQDLNQGCWQA